MLSTNKKLGQNNIMHYGRKTKRTVNQKQHANVTIKERLTKKRVKVKNSIMWKVLTPKLLQ